MSSSSVIVEADGGSRGNPGPAAYGALLKDAATGELIAEVGDTIGVASNNVAEYRGLIAGLELHREHAPDAGLEVRMDSRLVVEQMSGNWRIKHADMRALATQAAGLAPAGTTYTWIPRAENAHADRLVNAALDGPRATRSTKPARLARGWGHDAEPTSLVLVRHGVTDHTLRKLFSGGLSSANPSLNDEGRAQVRATAEWLVPLADEIDALVASPVRRTQESAEILAEVLGKEIVPEEGFAEMEFGSWDGMSFAEVHERHPDDLSAWLGSLDVAPGGGESFRSVEERVLAARDRILARHRGQSVLAVTHVTPIKTLVADALGAPLDAVYRMELAPASVTVLSYYEAGPDGATPMASLRLYNARPTEFAFG